MQLKSVVTEVALIAPGGKVIGTYLTADRLSQKQKQTYYSIPSQLVRPLGADKQVSRSGDRSGRAKAAREDGFEINLLVVTITRMRSAETPLLFGTPSAHHEPW